MSVQILRSAVDTTSLVMLYAGSDWRRLLVSQIDGVSIIYVGFESPANAARFAALPANRGWITLDLPPGYPFVATTENSGTIGVVVYDQPSPFDIALDVAPVQDIHSGRRPRGA